MKRVAPLFLTGLVALAACSDDLTPVAPSSVPAFNESAADGSDTYLVRFKNNGVPGGFAAQVAALGGEVVFAHPIGIAAVSGLNDASAAQLALDGTIAAVDADMETSLPEADVATLEAGDMAPESPTAPATSIRYPRQWHMQVIGAKKAWDAGKVGIPSVKVGILDSGLDYNHPDLVGRVDLNLSRSFLSAAENQRVINTWGPGTHPIADLHYHGTHVGSTVASNAYLSSGVTSKVTLVGLKACTPGSAPSFNGSCPTSGSLAAILYAADNGVNIINMSIGGSTTRRGLSAAGGFGPSLIATINQVFNYAHRKGTTIVVSAGNSALDLDHDGNGYKTFCSVPTVICVSATGPTSATTINGPWANIDALASYSNYGRSAISVAAPGGNGVSVTAACSGFTIVSALLPCRNRYFNSQNSWSAFSVGISGTSMAAPHVTGLAALIASDGITQPGQIRARIQQSADDLGEEGTDPKYGKGRINVARAFGL